MKIALLFPGQGAQYVGMASHLLRFKEAREVFEKASTVLGYDLLELIESGDEGMLSDTRVTQPAMIATEIATLRILEANGIKYEATLGQSLGEYGALVAAGVLSFEEAIDIVMHRGELMDAATPAGVGGMAAVIGLPVKEIEDIITPLKEKGVVTITNYNCPGQVVIGGEVGVLAAAVSELSEKAKKVVGLTVSGPFHTPLLSEASHAFGSYLEQYSFHEPTVDFVSNVVGDYVGKEEIKSLLCDQISHPVLFWQSLEKLLADGYDTFIECGPKKTLSSFVRQTAKNASKKVSIYHTSDQSGLLKLLGELK